MDLTSVTVSKIIYASPEILYDLWIDPNNPGGPWSGAKCSNVNPVVGGLFFFAVAHEGREWAHFGRFLQLERPHLVKYTWMSEATKGAESLVSITFERVTQERHRSETVLTLVHAGVPDDEMGRRHEEGWAWMLSTLAERFGDAQSTTLETHA